MKKTFILLASLTFIMGCMKDGEEKGFAESPAWHATSTNEAKIAFFEERCSIWFKSGTNEMSQCIREEMTNSQERAATKMARYKGTSYTSERISTPTAYRTVAAPTAYQGIGAPVTYRSPATPTTYRSVGNTIRSSDGTSCRRVGVSTRCSDGTSYRAVGNTIRSSDGTSYRRVGNTIRSSDGTSWRRVGNTIRSSDGTSCRYVGNTLRCF